MNIKDKSHPLHGTVDMTDMTIEGLRRILVKTGLPGDAHGLITDIIDRLDKSEARLESIKGAVSDCFDGFDADTDVEEVIRAVSNLFSASYMRAHEAEARADRAEKRIADALAKANGRFCEWGGRARMVEDILLGGDGEVDDD